MQGVVGLVVLSLLLAWGHAATTQFTCNFEMSEPSVSSYTKTTGSLKYDWDNGRYQLTFASTNTEIYFFNTGSGFTSDTDQFYFTSSTTCPCITAPLVGAMPQLVNSNMTLLAATGVANQYKPVLAAGVTPILQTVTFDATGYPSAAVFADTRTFTFSGCTTATYASSDWVQPTGCSCGTPQDVVIAWDRSSSISAPLFVEEKNFAVGLIKGFTYGPLETNLGMINFHTNTWWGPVNLDEGTTLDAALAGANALNCYPDPQCVVHGGYGTCCGSGTCIACGIESAADMLATKAVLSYERRNAAKVLILFTDGADDVISAKNGENPVYADNHIDILGDVSGLSPATPANVNADLLWAVAYAKRRVPGVQIYAVGVGLYNAAQLALIVDGDTSRVFASTDWTQIITFVSSLVTKTCTLAASPCATCCGSCSCSAWCRVSVSVGLKTCDDGNTESGDGCDSTCRAEFGYDCSGGSCKPICGDGVIRAPETCDDGNTVSGDGCSSTCSIEDGFICSTPGKPCTSVCGDGILRAPEACDDGNRVSGDGCSATCAIETGFTCPTAGAACVPICGDGLLKGDEQCDDGNTVSGDGCSSTCIVEPGYACTTPDKPCTDIDECTTYGCTDSTYGTKYPASCVESTTTKSVPINERVCSCPLGFVIKGTDQAKLDATVTLTGNASFPGCQDINECTMYGCVDPSNSGLAVNCTDSTSSDLVPVQYRDCTCPQPGWYAKESTTTPPAIFVELLNTTAFTGCESICGDGILAGDEGCDDGNTVSGDGCTSTCTVEPGYVCPHPGLGCCHILPSALQPYSSILDCWNGWWVSINKDSNGNLLPVTFGHPPKHKRYIQQDANATDDDAMVLDQDLKLCGPFEWNGTLVMNQNVTLTIAGTMNVLDGGNVTFISPHPADHGTIDMTDTCGIPGFTMGSEPQFMMAEGSSLNIHGLSWDLDARVYSSYIFVKHCIDTYQSELYVTSENNNSSGIPDDAQSFPIISASCLNDTSSNSTTGSSPTTITPPATTPGSNPNPAQFYEGNDNNQGAKPAFKNLTPKDLPGCSDVASFQKSGTNGTDIFVQTNKKDLCNSATISIATFVPFMLAAALAIAAALALGVGTAAAAATADDAYVAL